MRNWPSQLWPLVMTRMLPFMVTTITTTTTMIQIERTVEEYTGQRRWGHRSDAEVITAQNGAGDDNEDDSTNYSLEDAGIDDDEDNADDADMFVAEPAAAGVLESAVFAAHEQSVSIGNGNDGDKFRWNDGRNGCRGRQP